MNKVHQFLVDYIRKAASAEENAAKKLLDGKNDAEIVRRMFKNYRGRGENARGLRLTGFGIALMRPFFRSYEIKLPDSNTWGPAEILYLEHRSKLPYFISEKGELTMFDADLSIRLKLCDGDLKTMIEMDDLMD